MGSDSRGCLENMKRDRDFERQLANLNNEAHVIANYVYAEMAIQHAASKSKRLLDALNRTPTFWLTCQGSLQTAAYIAIARVFDDKNSRYNVAELLTSMEENLDLFSRDALKRRKSGPDFMTPKRLAEYVAAAHVCTRADVQRLRRSVQRRREFYERAIMPVRHQYLAHRAAHDRERVQALYSKGKLKELWRMSAFLLRLHDALWNQLHNGRKPNLSTPRYSPKVMYDSDTALSGPHERVVRDVRDLMQFLEEARLPMRER